MARQMEQATLVLGSLLLVNIAKLVPTSHFGYGWYWLVLSAFGISPWLRTNSSRQVRPVLVGSALGVAMGFGIIIFLGPKPDPRPMVQLVLLAPVLEEGYYRGFLTERLCKVSPAAWVGKGLSVLAFSLSHGFGVAALVGIVLGVVATLLVDRFDGLWPAVSMHVAYNLTYALLAR